MFKKFSCLAYMLKPLWFWQFMGTNISQQLGVFRENKIIESKLELGLKSFDKNCLGRGGFSWVEIFRVWLFWVGIFLGGNVSVGSLLVGNYPTRELPGRAFSRWEYSGCELSGWEFSGWEFSAYVFFLFSLGFNTLRHWITSEFFS